MRYTDGWECGRESLNAVHLAAVRGMILPGRERREVSVAYLDGDSVSLEAVAGDTEKVSMAGKMISEALRGSGVRFERVAALRLAIEAGTYRVSASEVAEKLMGALLR